MNGDDNKIPLILIEKIKAEVIRKLGVDSIFKLYDKLDGVFYLNKQLKRVLASYVIEKKFSVSLMNEEKILLAKSTFESNNKIYNILGIELNDTIKIPNLNVDIFLIVAFFDNYRKFKILGHISKDDCIKHNDLSKSSNNLVACKILAIVNKEDLKNI